MFDHFVNQFIINLSNNNIVVIVTTEMLILIIFVLCHFRYIISKNNVINLQQKKKYAHILFLFSSYTYTIHLFSVSLFSASYRLIECIHVNGTKITNCIK